MNPPVFALARYVKAAQKRYGVAPLPPIDGLPVEAITPPIPHWEMTFRD